MSSEAAPTSPAPATVPLDGATRDAWTRALALWGVRMHDAELRPGAGAERGAPAWFSFPPSVFVDPAMVGEMGGAAEMESVFAHEIGHHVLAPSTRIDALKIRHQLGRALVASGADAIRKDDLALLSNLWTDLLVNARVAMLQRRRDGEPEPGIIRLSRALYRDSYDTPHRLWWVYLRTYELVWNLPAATLCAAQPPAPPAPRAVDAFDEVPLDQIPAHRRMSEEMLRNARREAARIAAELDSVITTRPALDADLLAGLVRTFAVDPVGGALRFGVLAAPYLVEGQRRGGPGIAGAPGGCAADEAAPTPHELGRVLADRRLSGALPDRSGREPARGTGRSTVRAGDAPGQSLDLARTLELYSTVDAEAVTAAWYRLEATPWVRPLRQRRPARPVPELPGPLEAWELGDDLADIDWSATLQAGADIVPGVTTRRRSFLDDEPEPQESSIALDLYVDSSGSMPDPRDGSPAVLAGTILALSVLRGGGRVRVTSFSGSGQVAGDEAFSRDPARIVGDLAWFFAGGTTFPLDLLERRYAPLPPPAEEVRRHLVVLSDDGLESMFGVRNEIYAHVAAATRTKLTSGTLILMDRARRIEHVAAGVGYDTLFLKTMDDAPAVCARLAEALHG
ncbi:VWA domain-containing protein [Microbacterium sp. zg-Y818]|uniref:VWA domain-containing protein n=1 Tax=unclassified Microbacterium TaxID=2609290 RepID=UPI00214BFED0|nr:MULTISPECIES: VWA domain-containing protein [unclassified Microbacterium]MCR2799816.1 VWA domain-containing protein [Microbacterium sp. zg.Y818]WIM21799.1 VWA domain-containing protein [Microbacterium sp. zg-Y818]